MTAASRSSLLQRHRLSVLLALLLAGIVTQSFGTSTDFHPYAHDVLQTAIGVGTLIVVFQGRPTRQAATALLVVPIAGGWARHVLPPGIDAALFAVSAAFAVAYFCLAVAEIVYGLFTRPAPAHEKIAGAACGYLLAGAAWGPVNALAYHFAPEAFVIDPHVATLLHDWGARTAIWAYYSYTTMLTIGYADITAIRAPATTLSLLGALFGVFYTAVVVSQFVSIAQTAREKRDRGD